MAGGTAGDHDHDYGDDLYTVSTELLVHGASSWSEAGALSHAIDGPRIVSFDNQIISTG